MAITDLMKRASVLAIDLITSGGEITPEIDAELEKDQNEAVKTDFFGLTLHQVMMQAELARARISQWQAVQNSSEEALKKLKMRMKTIMEASGRTKITGEQSTFDIVPCKPAIIIKNPKAVPPEYMTVEYPEPTRKLESEKILADLTQGKEVPGCELSKETLLVHKVTLKEA